MNEGDIISCTAKPTHPSIALATIPQGSFLLHSFSSEKKLIRNWNHSVSKRKKEMIY